MKLYKSLLATMTLAVSSVALTGCDEDLAIPPLSIPSTDVQANMTIADFKTQYWSSDNNYCTQVGQNENGEDIILGGRIIASDEGGNIYQNVMLQDETGAVTIATLTSSNDGLGDLYTKYKVGEEMYINVTDLYAGKYAGLFQIGTAGDYNGTPQTSKMSATEFLSHTFLNGLPDPSKTYSTTMTIPQINGMTSVEDQQKWQSQLVKIENVSWIGGGELTWGEVGSSSAGVNRYLIDEAGNRLLVRNSNKSDFCDQTLPAGHGDVEGILSYYNGSWQFVFRSMSDCTDFEGENFGPKMEGSGTAEDPFTVGGVLAGAEGSAQWVTGYIVGWVEGQVLSTGAHFSVPATSASNLLLAATPDETNVANCIPVQLSSGTTVRTALNLKDHPENLGKQVTINGDLASYFGASGLKAPTTYAWGDKGDGSGSGDTDEPTTPAGTGDGSSDKPFEVGQVLSGATGTGVWMTGYIVGAINDKSLSDASFTAPFTLKTNLLIAASANETDSTKCVPVQLPAGSVRNDLNLNEHPENLGKQVTLKGNLEKYFGIEGMKSVSEYVWGAQGSGDTPAASSQYKKVTTVTSGKQYVLVVDGQVGTAISSSANYGRLAMSAVTINSDILTTDDSNAITITAVTGGYTLTDAQGRKLAMNNTNLSTFQLDYTGGEIWTITPDNGLFKIANVLNPSCYIVRSGTYTNIAPSNIEQYTTYTLPALYEKM